MLPDELLLNNDLFFIEVNRMLSKGCRVTMRPQGDSMIPFIKGGRDSIVLQKTKEVDTGYIVLAHIPEKGYVLHRIYRMQGERLTLMGDGNLHAREQCEKTEVSGKVIRILRNGRYVECDSFRERFKADCWRRLLEKPNKFDPFGQTKSAHLVYHMITPLKVLAMGSILFYPFNFICFS